MTDIFSGPRRKPDRRTRVALRVEHWPDEDRARWEAAFLQGDIFAESGAGAHLASPTRKARADAYGRWLGFLVQHEPRALTLAADKRVTRGRIIRFCELLAETNSPLSIATTLMHLRLALPFVTPSQDWMWLLTIIKRTRAKARPRPKRPRQRESHELYALGIELMEAPRREAERTGSITMRHALMYRDGLMIAVLSLAPMRKRSFANLMISKHLFRPACPVTTIRLDESQTKNRRSIEYPLIPELEIYLVEYLTRFRQAFVRARPHDALWPSAKGCPLTGNAIYDAVCRRTKAAFGQPMGLHLFRDAAATSLAIHVPAQVRAAADLLGHSSFRPTQRHYIRAQGVTAGRSLAEAIRKRVARGR